MMLCTQYMATAVTKQTIAGDSKMQYRIDSVALCVRGRRENAGFHLLATWSDF